MIDLTTFDYVTMQAKFELDVFGKRGITLVRGKGATLYDDRGKSYIDCMGGQGSANLGHAHPRIIDILTKQAAILMSCPGSFANDQRAHLMQELIAIAPGDLNRVFLCNSGTESIEAALKFARISTGRSGIIAAKKGFHGRTFGAMTATHNPQYSRGCGPLVPNFHHVAFNRIQDLESAVTQEVAAVLLEVIQGEGGVIPATREYLDAARRLCTTHGAILIIDEVQTGFCRTGRMFSIEHTGIVPDILCLAKSMAAGFPMGAVLVNEKIKVEVGQHGSTFGGNPLACAVSREALAIMQEEGLAEQAKERGNQIVDALQTARPLIIREIRHLGLMIGIELKVKVRPILEMLAQKGILALPAGNTVLRLLPPLVINQSEAEHVSRVLLEVFDEFKP